MRVVHISSQVRRLLLDQLQDLLGRVVGGRYFLVSPAVGRLNDELS